MQERFAPLFEEPFALAVMSGFRKGQKAEFSKVTVTPFDKKRGEHVAVYLCLPQKGDT